jgi:hypothetical protein
LIHWNKYFIHSIYLLIINLKYLKYNKGNKNKLDNKEFSKNVYNMNKNKIDLREKELKKESQKKARTLTKNKSKLLKIKKYYQELNSKSENPKDLNLLTL